jgi:hypothetical protein
MEDLVAGQRLAGSRDPERCILGVRCLVIEASTSKSRRGRAVVFGDSTAKALTRYLTPTAGRG